MLVSLQDTNPMFNAILETIMMPPLFVGLEHIQQLGRLLFRVYDSLIMLGFAVFEHI